MKKDDSQHVLQQKNREKRKDEINKLEKTIYFNQDGNQISIKDDISFASIRNTTKALSNNLSQTTCIYQNILNFWAKQDLVQCRESFLLLIQFGKEGKIRFTTQFEQVFYRVIMDSIDLQNELLFIVIQFLSVIIQPHPLISKEQNSILIRSIFLDEHGTSLSKKLNCFIRSKFQHMIPYILICLTCIASESFELYNDVLQNTIPNLSFLSQYMISIQKSKNSTSILQIISHFILSLCSFSPFAVKSEFFSKIYNYQVPFSLTNLNQGILKLFLYTSFFSKNISNLSESIHDLINSLICLTEYPESNQIISTNHDLIQNIQHFLFNQLSIFEQYKTESNSILIQDVLYFYSSLICHLSTPFNEPNFLEDFLQHFMNFQKKLDLVHSDFILQLTFRVISNIVSCKYVKIDGVIGKILYPLPQCEESYFNCIYYCLDNGSPQLRIESVFLVTDIMCKADFREISQLNSYNNESVSLIEKMIPFLQIDNSQIIEAILRGIYHMSHSHGNEKSQYNSDQVIKFFEKGNGFSEVESLLDSDSSEISQMAEAFLRAFDKPLHNESHGFSFTLLK